MSLKKIGELSDVITDIRGIKKNSKLSSSEKIQDITNLINSLDDLDIANKVFKKSGVGKGLAEEIVNLQILLTKLLTHQIKVQKILLI